MRLKSRQSHKPKKDSSIFLLFNRNSHAFPRINQEKKRNFTLIVIFAAQWLEFRIFGETCSANIIYNPGIVRWVVGTESFEFKPRPGSDTFMKSSQKCADNRIHFQLKTQSGTLREFCKKGSLHHQASLINLWIMASAVSTVSRFFHKSVNNRKTLGANIRR